MIGSSRALILICSVIVAFSGNMALAWTFADTKKVSISYEIDYEGAVKLLPATWIGDDGKTYGYRPLAVRNGKAVLTITWFRNCSLSTTGCYNELAGTVTAEFIGENSWEVAGQEYLLAEGVYIMVLWLNDDYAIYGARENLGWPKVAAIMPDPVYRHNFGYYTAQAGGDFAPDKTFVEGYFWGLHSDGAAAAQYYSSDGSEAVHPSGWGERSGPPDPYGYFMGWQTRPGAAFLMEDRSYGTGIPYSWEEGPEGPEVCVHGNADPLVGTGMAQFNAVTLKEFPSAYKTIELLKDAIENHCTHYEGNVLVTDGCLPIDFTLFHAFDGPAAPVKAP